MDEKQKQKLMEEINKEMQKALSRMAGDRHDSQDIAYVMAEAYFRTQGLKLADDKIYQDKKHIADLIECDHNGQKLHIKFRYTTPLHDVVLDFEEKNGKNKG